MDLDTGEVIKDKFAQLYFKDIERLFSLNGTDIGILFLMIKSIGLGNGTELNMNPQRKKEFAKRLNLKSHQQVTNSLSKLCTNGVLKKKEENERFDFCFIVNPDIVFSGNEYQRTKVLIDYSGGKRNLKVFENEEKLSEFLAKG